MMPLEKIFKLAVVLSIAFLLVFVSCGGGGSSGGSGGGSGGGGKPQVGERFYAQNFKTNRSYTLMAEQLAQGARCTVWVEIGSGVDQASAQLMANEYDNVIYPRMMSTFNSGDFTLLDESFTDVMDFADWFGDEDGKLCILMLDIKDDYKAGVNESYIGGYFSPVNFTTNSNSNRRDMIYVDTYPGFAPGKRKETYATLAHEMQHLMNFATDFSTRITQSGSNLTVSSMDVWINEGLSTAAEWVYLQEHTEDRKVWFDIDPSGMIAQGNNFFIWGNYANYPYALNDDYYTVYLFFQWLRLQSDSSIYKKIISSDKTDYQAVTRADGLYTTDWETLLRDWYLANYINASSDRHGYLNEPVLKEVKFPFFPGYNESWELFPGEGVYSIAPSAFEVPSNPASPNKNIRHVGISSAGSLVNSGSSVTGALLTYNVNTNLKGDYEWGTLTGEAPPPKANIVVNTIPGSRSVVSSVLPGPFPISAQDMLRQNGHEDAPFEIDFSKFVKGAKGE
jgi:hypothetical protein